MPKGFAALMVVVVTTLGLVGPAGAQSPNPVGIARTVPAGHRVIGRGNPAAITGRYIVVFEKDTKAFNWVVVAASESPDSSEDISYAGTSGYYLWEVSHSAALAATPSGCKGPRS